jgi:hypothetical protein
MQDDNDSILVVEQGEHRAEKLCAIAEALSESHDVCQIWAASSGRSIVLSELGRPKPAATRCILLHYPLIWTPSMRSESQ